MSNSYKVKLTDPANGLFEGQAVTPYHEDDKEIILHGVPGSNMDQHIKKGGAYIAKHLEPIGGK